MEEGGTAQQVDGFLVGGFTGLVIDQVDCAEAADEAGQGDAPYSSSDHGGCIAVEGW
jgi:hypothetical protein